ncbi:MAG: Extensin family protein [Xanthobacteraceae bacterium]|jgi:hypothetical protein|nr:Extensin family protein [Xanthobacteraceae bacterium]
MTRGVFWFCVAPLVLLGLSGCQFSFEQREPWRAEAEERCLAEGLVKSSAYTMPVREIDGAGTCGMDHPFKVSGLAQGQVAVAPTATLACPVTASLDRWIMESVQPAAMTWFGQPVARIKQISAYSCRNMNGGRTGKISEHAFGNALDIAAFTLADGREVVVKTGWKGAPEEQGFLRTVQAGACERFSTVLAPGSNVYHYDHIHVDLMRRSSGRGICQPAPRMPQPPPGPPMASQYPSQYPAQYPSQMPPNGSTYPPSAEPAAAEEPMHEGEPGPSDYGHGVDPSYQPSSRRPQQPQPAGYPGGVEPGYLPPAPMPSGGYRQPYPANPYPPTAPRYPPPSGPLPPAGVPMVKWQRGTDPVVTGSTRSYAPEPKSAAKHPFSFIAPIDLPKAVPGED